ncbi:ASK10 [Candida pseudojiufengensis]|uniref:ASK10 n=1 Tax=Candida pseudojiufengensis TaxID=497109 RepID=UPI002223F213|nr:ASK10 [Candida pseudojiufengensis]KAI5958693.1 ASK10 [Candida pseudojiufengensis]
MNSNSTTNSNFKFEKEKILPSTNSKSPFYYNLPPYDSKPIDNLIEFFKFWKYFIKSIIYYLKEIVLVKELESNLNYQLIQAVQFPGCRDLPNKILQDIQFNNPNLGGTISPKNNTTPTKEIKKNLSSSSLNSLTKTSSNGNNSNGQSNGNSTSNANLNINHNGSNNGSSLYSSANNNNSSPQLQHLPSKTGTTQPIEKQRPGLFKTKSNNNQSFLKNAATNLHKKNNSLTSLRQLVPTNTNNSFNSITSGGGSNSPNHQQHFPHLHSESITSHLPHLHQQPNHHQQPPPNPPGATTPPLNAETSTNTNDVRIPSTYFPENSLYTNLPAILLSSHHQAFNNSFKLKKDLNSKLIPRMEILLKQVSNKIKEIKLSLKNDAFANTELSKEISQTGQILSKYMSSVETYCGIKPVVKNRSFEQGDEEEYAALDDPLLVKLKVDSRLKTQLIFENYMFASYMNLQNISKDLFTYILKELNFVVDKISKLDLNPMFYNFFKTKISQSSTKDWEYFIMNNNCFVNTFQSTDLNPKRDIRNFKSIELPYSKSIQNKCLRFGIMYKKSKLMKNYTRYYYVLSCNYLHEFKFDEELNQSVQKKNTNNSVNSNSTTKTKDKIGGFIGFEDEPVKSYNLNDYQIATKDELNFKFTLTKISNKSKKTFKLNNQQDYNLWFEDLFELLKFGNNHYERFKFIENKVEQSNNLNNQNQGAPKRKNDLTIDLNNSKPTNVNNNLSTQNEALSGMFTPRIKTPNQSPKTDSNPFDEVFSDLSMQNANVNNKSSSNLSSPNYTPRNLTPTDTQFNINKQPQGQPPPHQQQTQQQQQDSKEIELLKLQKAFMKQQQEIIELRSKESEKFNILQKKLQDFKILQDNQNSNGENEFKNKDSNESLNSFINTRNIDERNYNHNPIEFNIGNNNRSNFQNLDSYNNTNSNSSNNDSFNNSLDGSTTKIPQVFVTED